MMVMNAIRFGICDQDPYQCNYCLSAASPVHYLVESRKLVRFESWANMMMPILPQDDVEIECGDDRSHNTTRC